MLLSAGICAVFGGEVSATLLGIRWGKGGEAEGSKGAKKRSPNYLVSVAYHYGLGCDCPSCL